MGGCGGGEVWESQEGKGEGPEVLTRRGASGGEEGEHPGGVRGAEGASWGLSAGGRESCGRDGRSGDSCTTCTMHQHPQNQKIALKAGKPFPNA